MYLAVYPELPLSLQSAETVQWSKTAKYTEPSLSCTSTVAPCSRRACASSRCPLTAATCSGAKLSAHHNHTTIHITVQLAQPQDTHYNCEQVAQLLQRDRATGCVSFYNWQSFGYCGHCWAPNWTYSLSRRCLSLTHSFSVTSTNVAIIHISLVRYVFLFIHKIFIFALSERWLKYHCETVCTFVYLISVVLLHKFDQWHLVRKTSLCVSEIPLGMGRQGQCTPFIVGSLESS